MSSASGTSRKLPARGAKTFNFSSRGQIVNVLPYVPLAVYNTDVPGLVAEIRRVLASQIWELK
jgi:hypothetical protein